MENFVIQNFDSIRNLSDTDIRLLLLVMLISKDNGMLPLHESLTKEEQVEEYLKFIKNGL